VAIGCGLNANLVHKWQHLAGHHGSPAPSAHEQRGHRVQRALPGVDEMRSCCMSALDKRYAGAKDGILRACTARIRSAEDSSAYLTMPFQVL